jgi:vitamin B12 transporter
MPFMTARLFLIEISQALGRATGILGRLTVIATLGLFIPAGVASEPSASTRGNDPVPVSPQVNPVDVDEALAQVSTEAAALQTAPAMAEEHILVTEDFWSESPLAQTRPGPQEPSLDQAQGEPLRINVTGEILNQPVFSPFRREGTVRESSQPVYVINRQQMEAQGARTVQEALRYLPGVLSDGTTGGQLGALSGQFIRGSTTNQTLILLDGRPLNEVGAGGGFDLSTLTIDAVEQIEVLPGGGSVLYGSNAIGGVINIITRRTLAEDGLEIAADAAVGSFGFNDQIIQLRGTEGNGSWVIGYNRTAADNNFPFSLTSTDFEGTRRNADVLYNNVNVKLVGDIDDRNQLRFGFLYLSKDLGVPGGVPVPDSISGGFNALTEDDRQYSESWLMDVTYESALGQGDDSLLTARFYADLTDLTFTDAVADSPFETPTQRVTDQTSLGAQLQHAWQFARNQNITYGVDYRNVQADNSTLDLLTDQRTLNYSDTINQLGLFARYQADFTPRFSANLGIRQDFNDLADGSFTSFSVGTQVKITETTNFRANVARNFRVPTLADLYFEPFNNPNLGPESSLGFDVGVDQQIGDRGLFRFTFFRNDIRDAISFDLATFTPQNIGRVESIGIETEVNYQLFDDWFVFANYTWNDPTIQSGPDPDNNGNLLPFTHADAWNLGLAYENLQGWYAALFLNSISNFFVDRGNQESLAGRTTLDFKLRVPISPALALNASVDNIFDTQYEEFPGFPGVGRNFQIGVRSTF